MSMGSEMLLGVYSGLWRAATPLLRRHKRLREGFADRLVPDGWPWFPEATTGAPPLRLWIQAASGGEAWLVHSLLPALERALAAVPTLAARPLQALCTTCTRQGLDVLEKLAPEGGTSNAGTLVLPRYFPLDRPDLMRKALRAAAPEALLLLETELWPGLLAAAGEQGRPVLVLNARMTEKSALAYGLLAPFWRMRVPRRVLAVSDADAGRFAALFGGRTEVSVMPNIKFDRVAASLARTDEPAADMRRAIGAPEPCRLVVLASVREEEETLLLPTIKILYGRRAGGVPVAVAVAPRHMHRVSAWKERLQAEGVPCVLRSAGAAPPPAQRAGGGDVPPVFLWDTFGELEALYAAADAVFVGGSLAPLGGQNFLEPLAQGVRPVIGPYVKNFLWVGRDIVSCGLVRQISGPDALPEALLQACGPDDAADGAAPVAPGVPCVAAEAGIALQSRAAVQREFAAWLAGRTGGSAVAAGAVVSLLALSCRSEVRKDP